MITMANIEKDLTFWKIEKQQLRIKEQQLRTEKQHLWTEKQRLRGASISNCGQIL